MQSVLAPPSCDLKIIWRIQTFIDHHKLILQKFKVHRQLYIIRNYTVMYSPVR